MIGSNGHQATAVQLPLEAPQAVISSPARTEHHGPLHWPRLAALVVLAVLAVAASVTSFAESYHGLYLWALAHDVTGGWARAWPIQVDVFVAAPELVLFVALIDAWRTRDRVACWLVAAAGLAVSATCNAGHVTGALNRGTNAIPPLAAAACLAFGLAVLKRIISPPGRHVPAAGYGDQLAQRAAALYRDQLARGQVPGIRIIKQDMRVGQYRAQRIRGHLRELVRAARLSPAPRRHARAPARACFLRPQDGYPRPATGRPPAGDRCAVRASRRVSRTNRRAAYQ